MWRTRVARTADFVEELDAGDRGFQIEERCSHQPDETLWIWNEGAAEKNAIPRFRVSSELPGVFQRNRPIAAVPISPTECPLGTPCPNIVPTVPRKRAGSYGSFAGAA